MNFSKLIKELKTRSKDFSSVEHSEIIKRSRLINVSHQGQSNIFDLNTGHPIYIDDQHRWSKDHKVYYLIAKNNQNNAVPMFTFQETKEDVYTYVSHMNACLSFIRDHLDCIVPDRYEKSRVKVNGYISELLQEFDIITNNKYKKEGINSRDIPCNKTSKTLYTDIKQMDETTKKEFMEKNPDYPENAAYYFCLKSDCLNMFTFVIDLCVSLCKNEMKYYVSSDSFNLGTNEQYQMKCSDFLLHSGTNQTGSNFNLLYHLMIILCHYRIPVVCQNVIDKTEDIHNHFKYVHLKNDHIMFDRVKHIMNNIVQSCVFEIQKNRDSHLLRQLIHHIEQIIKHFFKNSKFKNHFIWVSQIIFKWCSILFEKLGNVKIDQKMNERLESIMYQMMFFNLKTDSVAQFFRYTQWIKEYKLKDNITKDYLIRTNIIRDDLQSGDIILFTNNQSNFVCNMFEYLYSIDKLNHMLEKYMKNQLIFFKKQRVIDSIMCEMAESEFYHHWFNCIFKTKDESLQTKLFYILVENVSDQLNQQIEKNDTKIINNVHIIDDDNDDDDDDDNEDNMLIDLEDSTEKLKMKIKWEKIIISHYTCWMNHWKVYDNFICRIEPKTKNQTEKNDNTEYAIPFYQSLFRFYICCFMYQKFFCENMKTLSQFPMIKVCYDRLNENEKTKGNEMAIILLINVFMLLTIQ